MTEQLAQPNDFFEFSLRKIIDKWIEIKSQFDQAILHVASKCNPDHVCINKNHNTYIGIWDERHPRGKATDVPIMGHQFNTLVGNYIPAQAIARTLPKDIGNGIFSICAAHVSNRLSGEATCVPSGVVPVPNIVMR